MNRCARLTSVLLVLLLLAAACGQKEGVHNGPQVGFASGQGAGGTADGTALGDGGELTEDGVYDDGLSEDASGELALSDDPTADAGGMAVGDAPAEPVDDGGGAGQASAPAGDAGGGAAQPPADSGGGGAQGGQAQPPADQGQAPQGEAQQQQQQQQKPAGPNDTKGVTDKVIRIGLHAPLSGAAPLPQASFESGREQYWKAVGPVEGRQVQVIVRDDQYNPSRATSVCNQLIQQDEVFILVGGGGADQIAACARTAAQQGVPYLSAGVDEGALRQLKNYFAVSMSYVQQAPLLADLIAKRHRPDDGRVAIVRDRTPGFNNVVAKVGEELGKRGLKAEVIQYQNGPSTAQAVSSYKTAFAIMAPSQFVQIVRSPGGAAPQWVGVGITMGLNTVADAACKGGNAYKGEFFSPFPGLNVIKELDPKFPNGDDIELALWGLNKTIHQVFQKMGGNLTRSNFVQTMQTNVIETNVYPTLRHSPDNHFGADSVHLLVAKCSANGGVYETPPGGTFVKGF